MKKLLLLATFAIFTTAVSAQQLVNPDSRLDLQGEGEDKHLLFPHWF